jgi:membrane protein
MLVAVFIGGLAFGQKAAESRLVAQIQDLTGPQGASAIHALLQGTRNTTHGIFATIAGIVTLFFGASGVLVELRNALNTIWEVPTDEAPGLHSIVQMLKERLFSFALILAIGFLLLVSLLINVGIAAAGTYFNGLFPIPEAALHLVNSLVSLVVIAVMFGAIFKVIPDVQMEWLDAFAGGSVTSFLFIIGKFLIGLYLGKAGFASTYGAAASVVIFIVWVYYSAQIFFLGAEFTRCLTQRRESGAGKLPRDVRSAA